MSTRTLSAVIDEELQQEIRIFCTINKVLLKNFVDEALRRHIAYVKRQSSKR